VIRGTARDRRGDGPGRLQMNGLIRGLKGERPRKIPKLRVVTDVSKCLPPEAGTVIHWDFDERPTTSTRAGTAAPTDVAPLERAEAQMQALCEDHVPSLYRFLYRLTLGQMQLAEDLLQETLLRAWQHMERLADDTEMVRPWLFTVARRVAIDAARARRARPVELGDVDLSSSASTRDDIQSVVVQQSVRWALKCLSGEHRGVLIDMYYNDCTTAEVSASLGIPEGTVRSRVFYALRAMRELLSDPPASATGTAEVPRHQARRQRPSRTGSRLPAGDRGQPVDRHAARPR
jgi:RNA polymerase sigma-70 factor, ECF subfamily